ncbi:glycosyltransferase family 2 protein [Pseudorhodoplanes sp.]|uniref:glycosyltransferase family 2 protein n=1 Tax=Pseudorhodoplanes sp. TaxID=1934341 RepID=UPI003D0FE7D4
MSAELIAALLLPLPRIARGLEENATYVVVIPAHDEAGTIEQTLAAVVPELAGHGSILVVADNCTDETAAAARSAGASVIVRRDPRRRGKGYAIDFAVKHLANSPPDVVIILDADCTPDPGTFAILHSACRHWNRPVQARYELVRPKKDAGPLARVGYFAWQIKNILRPAGLSALRVPCLLTGTGMAFPWRTLASSQLATGHIVEDMVLGLELAARDQGALFLPEACVRSALPPSLEGQKTQRTRWETGHLQVIRQQVPWLIAQAVLRLDYRLLTLALHTAVPPLALFGLMLPTITGASGILALLGGPTLAFRLSGLAIVMASVVFAAYWHLVGRNLLFWRDLALLPGYVAAKIPLYVRALAGRQVQWIRSKRD